MIDKEKVVELSEFLNLEPVFIRMLYRALTGSKWQARFIQTAVDDWNLSNINQDRQNEIEHWFKTNDKYIFELSDVHSQPGKKKIIANVLKLCKRLGVNKVLDYGGGIGEESIQASQQGMRVAMADLPSLTFDFAKWRAKQRKLRIRFIPIRKDFPTKEYFDAIFCFEVLQHLFSPERIAFSFIKHLKRPGYLFITTRFKNPSYSIALKRNYKYKDGMKSFFTSNGLRLYKKLHIYGTGKKSKYLFIYQKS